MKFIYQSRVFFFIFACSVSFLATSCSVISAISTKDLVQTSQIIISKKSDHHHQLQRQTERNSNRHNKLHNLLVTNFTNNQLTCHKKLQETCDFFQSTLLIIKLNPVRLLWLDILLRFYSLGFKHIAFFAPLEKSAKPPQNPNRKMKKNSSSDTAKNERRLEYLRVGQYDTLVHLIDDNYGFCDHETVAASMELYGDVFDGFFFLSDDVLMQFWRFSNQNFDLKKYWRQPTTSGKIERTPNHDAAWNDAVDMFPDLKLLLSGHQRRPFASTSGIYYVPAFRNTVVGENDRKRFIAISGILNHHRTYNEWGTPFLLECVSRRAYELLKGKLVWGSKRHFVAKMPQSKYLWFHPVRAGGELFARIESAVMKSISSSSENKKNILLELDYGTVFSNKNVVDVCFDCATYPMDQRGMKSLLHSCVEVDFGTEEVVDENTKNSEKSAFIVDSCSLKSSDRDERQQIEAVKKLWPIMGADHVAKFLTGKRFRVRRDRDQVSSPFELKHEGFWNEKIVREVFDEFYPQFAEGTEKVQMSSVFWNSYPECCVMK